MPTEKVKIGEMMVDSDALLVARQHVQMFYLPAAGAWRHKLSLEQRLVENGRDSAPTVCVRFQSFGTLSVFMKDLFLKGYLDFGLREGLDLDWLEDDLVKAVRRLAGEKRLEKNKLFF